MAFWINEIAAAIPSDTVWIACRHDDRKLVLAANGYLMSAIDPNPGRGFVALPVEIFEIEMSPGAFRALAEFCRMADREGFCWPSLEQVGHRLGRSRASVSGYVKELRSLGLLSTREQKIANGYNYRLKFQVTFWKAWRARLSQRQEMGSQAETNVAVRSSAPQPTERRVQPVERPKGKNKIHINQSSGETPIGRLQSLHQAWKRVIGSAPYPACDGEADAALIEETRRNLSADPVIRETDPVGTLVSELSRFGIVIDENWKREMCRELAPLERVPGGGSLLATELRKAWRPHWRFAPSKAFIVEIKTRILAENPETALTALLSGYLRRWENHCGTLSGRLRNAL